MCSSPTKQFFQDFNHLITTRPHDIHEVFISDLHLIKDSPLVDAFLSLLADLSSLPNLRTLYILGDWFDVWIGDDAYLNQHKKRSNHWITPIVDTLKKMRIKGCRTLVLTGNRDFLMRQPFCNSFAGEMLTQPHFIQIGKQSVRLEHGDALCTDDKSYQKFRKYAHHPITQWWLLNKPLEKRQKIADKLRNKSKQSHLKKSMDIMDVNETAVQYALTPSLDAELITRSKNKNITLPPNSDMMIHGHTHRPAVHNLDALNEKSHAHCSDHRNIKTRYVLGDWRADGSPSQQKVTAVIGAVYLNDDEEIFGLFEFVYR